MNLVKPVVGLVAEIKGPQIAPLAEQTLSLSDRSPVGQVNQIFVDNILLNLHYLAKQDQPVPIDWGQVHQAGSVHFWLKPGDLLV